MKKTCVYTAMGLFCASILGAAEPIDSKVIHNYNQFGVGYTYVESDDLDGHGVIGSASVELSNFLLGGGANYVWFDDAESWSVEGFAGYILRLMENHINIIPRVGVGYNDVSVDLGPFGDVDADVVTIKPGITLSYAINNHVSLNGGYTYIQDIDGDVDIELHTFSLGTRVAIAENLGLNFDVLFEEEQGFSGVAAILSWHF
jgi:opacity protein-like surface antigen